MRICHHIRIILRRHRFCIKIHRKWRRQTTVCISVICAKRWHNHVSSALRNGLFRRAKDTVPYCVTYCSVESECLYGSAIKPLPPNPHARTAVRKHLNDILTRLFPTHRITEAACLHMLNRGSFKLKSLTRKLPCVLSSYKTM